MSRHMFIVVLLAGGVLGVIALTAGLLIGAQNKAINLEEQINQSYSAIEIQEKRRVDLVYNLVDTVQEYDKHEKETLTELTEARAMASQGKVDEARTAINAVAENYPELKSIGNYQTLMTELAVTENLIAEHRNTYNVHVRTYNKHIRTFPNRWLLNVVAYEPIDMKYLEYDEDIAPQDAPQDLFDRDRDEGEGEDE